MTIMSEAQESAALALPEGLHDKCGQLLQALCTERRNAIAMCADTDLLDRMGRLLLLTLKQTPGVQLEVLRPTSSEALLGRFNEAVEALPLEKARSARNAGTSLTVWVMHLSRRVDLPEVKLLLNMVSAFPGTGVRLLLLCTRDAASAEAVQATARWGSRLHRWMIQPASLADVKPDVSNPVAAPTVVERRERKPRWFSAVWAWQPFDRFSGLDGLRAGLVRRLRALQPRLAWGVGGVLMSVGATAAAWWQARSGSEDAAVVPLRRPVPEIVELLEDSRPRAVRQEQRS